MKEDVARMAVELLCHSALQNQLASLLSHNLNRFFGRVIKGPIDDTALGMLPRPVQQQPYSESVDMCVAAA